MQRAQRTAAFALVFCAAGAAFTMIATYGVSWYYEKQRVTTNVYTSLGINLRELSSVSESLSTLYRVAIWLLTLGAATLFLGGLAVAGVMRRFSLAKTGLIAIVASASLLVVMWLVLIQRPGFTSSEPGLTYPLGPGAWLGACGALAALLATGFAVASYRTARASAPMIDTDQVELE